jgi:hypothetical protein
MVFTLQSRTMDAARALDQIAEIHRQMAKSEVYRGYRSVPVAMSGAIGLIAAWFQPRSLAAAAPVDFLAYWTAIAAAAAFVGSIEILYNYAVKEDASGRRQTRRVVGQFLPSLAGGVVISASFARLSPALVPLLPGLWAICFGIGIFACRPYLPRASGWIALFYFAAGCALLWLTQDAGSLRGWWVGGTFGVGQLLAAVVLWWNLERT